MDTRISGSPDLFRTLRPQSVDGIEVKTELQKASEIPLSVKQASDEVAQAELKLVVDELNELARSAGRDIAFQLDDDTGRVVVNVTERETGKVIRQIPSKEALELANRLDEARSLLLKAEA